MWQVLKGYWLETLVSIQLFTYSPGSKSAVIAVIAGSTTKGIRNRKAKTERIAVVPVEKAMSCLTFCLQIKVCLTQKHRCVPLCFLQVSGDYFFACQRPLRRHVRLLWACWLLWALTRCAQAKFTIRQARCGRKCARAWSIIVYWPHDELKVSFS